MAFQTLTLPIDKMHSLRKEYSGWEYVVQETATFKKAYYLYPNEVDVKTYNFDGFSSLYPELYGAVVVTLHDEAPRMTQTYDLKGKLIREDALAILQIFENLKRCTSQDVEDKLSKKKASAKPLERLQSVELPLDGDHVLIQTSSGLWRYESKLSSRIYVFNYVELNIKQTSVVITPFKRKMRMYDHGKPQTVMTEDIIVYLITKEKERYFEDTVTCVINESFVINRRGWGKYMHFLDNELFLHAFLLGPKDETPLELPNVLPKNMQHISKNVVSVILHEDAYEDQIVNMATGEYKPTGKYFAAIRLAKPLSSSPFKDQKGLIEKYQKKDTRAVQGMHKGK